MVYIKWIDIIHEHGWHSVDDLENFDVQKEKIVHHVAFLYEEDEEQIIIVDSFFEDKETFGTVHIIPKGTILEMRELK